MVGDCIEDCEAASHNRGTSRGDPYVRKDTRQDRIRQIERLATVVLSHVKSEEVGAIILARP